VEKNIDINFLCKLGEENEWIPGCAEVEALPSGAAFFSVYRRLPVVSSIEYMRCIVKFFFVVWIANGSGSGFFFEIVTFRLCAVSVLEV